jgi:hypothetical protein
MDLCHVPCVADESPVLPPVTCGAARVSPVPCVPPRESCDWTCVVCVGCVQICKSHAMDKKSLKTLILRQKDELGQCLDYLKSIRNYCG